MRILQCRRRGLIAGIVALCLAAITPAPALEPAAAVAPIQQLVDGLLQVMKAGRATPFQIRYAMLGAVIDQTFDLRAILAESVGPTWETMSPADQAMLMDAFRRYTVTSYVNSFDNFDGQQFQVSPDTRSVGNDVIVATKILPRSGDGHELDYVMRAVGSAWRAVDVLADGSISRVAVQRSDFRRLLATGGATALATSLRNKTADMIDGTG